MRDVDLRGQAPRAAFRWAEFRSHRRSSFVAGFVGAGLPAKALSGYAALTRPTDARRQLRDIEHADGRPSGGPKFSPRTLDIDVLLYGDYCGSSCGLVLPQDEIERYAFALCTLAELAPDAIHPRSNNAAETVSASAAVSRG